jgi:hypothetical protein
VDDGAANGVNAQECLPLVVVIGEKGPIWCALRWIKGARQCSMQSPLMQARSRWQRLFCPLNDAKGRDAWPPVQYKKNFGGIEDIQILEFKRTGPYRRRQR